jgi:hypothetical protein
MGDLLQNGVFSARSSCFGRSIWILYAACRYVFWRLLDRGIRWCYLNFYIYHLQRIPELEKVLFIRYCMVFCISVDIQHLEMLIVVVHTIFKSFLSWMNLFETVLRTFEIVSKAFELWILHVTV